MYGQLWYILLSQALVADWQIALATALGLVALFCMALLRVWAAGWEHERVDKYMNRLHWWWNERIYRKIV